jgi:trimethylamine monooxygenase
VTYNDKTGKFTVISEDTRNGSRSVAYFDYVIVATGHFSVPNYIPPYPGMEHYDGTVIHSHNFRDAKDYAGKKLLVIGNGYSGEDIAMQCCKFGAHSATVCYQEIMGPMGHNFGDMPIYDSPLPERYDAATKEFVFVDGKRGHFDAVIYCTGYRHVFPFLSGDMELHTPNRLVPDMLWKGSLHTNNAKLMFVGAPDQYYTFSAFHAVGKFTIGVIEGRVAIPSKEAMLADIKKWQDREDNMGSDHKVHHRLQYEYTEEAAALGGGHLRDDSALFDQWVDDRHHSILTYRDQSAVSPVSGVASLSFGMPWVKMFTDDKEAYLQWCKAASRSKL